MIPERMMTRRPFSALPYFPLWLLLAALATALAPARADVKLPQVFGSHMVLQRDQPLPVWGWADPDEDVSIVLGDGAAVRTKADAAGSWKVMLPVHAAGGPLQLTVKGKNQVVLDDVLVGEVWVCSGQSNMEMGIGIANDAKNEIANANYPQIHLCVIPKKVAGQPQSNVDCQWQPCSPKTVESGGWGGFSAAAYYMARTLYQKLNVPIGMIDSSWGGTRIEPWVPVQGFALVPVLKPQLDQILLADPHNDAYKTRLADYLKQIDAWTAKAKDAMASQSPIDPAPVFPNELKPLNQLPSPESQPTTLYNAMIAPLVPFAIRGAIWYQGESNHGEGKLYTAKMHALIEGWRKVWGQGDFPFYYVEIAPFNYGNEPANVMAEFWEAQAAALEIPNTGEVVTNDIGDFGDIHPKNKQEVGRRLALLALKGAYGKADLVANGPIFKALTVEGDKLRISFDNTGSGLASRDGKPLTWFQVAGEDKYTFVDADASIDGDTVLLSSPQETKPRAMTFGWNKAAAPNLMNKEGLPARPFRAGEVPKHDSLAEVPEAKDLTLVYDLDLAKLSHDIQYDVDNKAKVGAFDRIAYFVELQQPGQPVHYVYVSMDAFTKEIGKIGIPTLASGATFQQKVANVNVVSNAPGIVNGTGLKGCNIEFWPNNYGPQNAINIPGADDNLYDFGDQMSDPQDGYGSMQVHNYEAKQTLFAINHWTAGGGADLGIGNSEGDKARDWTFAGNAGTYQAKRLRVFVHEVK